MIYSYQKKERNNLLIMDIMKKKVTSLKSILEILSLEDLLVNMTTEVKEEMEREVEEEIEGIEETEEVEGVEIKTVNLEEVKEVREEIETKSQFIKINRLDKNVTIVEIFSKDRNNSRIVNILVYLGHYTRKQAK